MNSGCVTAMRVVLRLTVGLFLLSFASVGLAQTPEEEACENNYLYLVSPDELSLQQQTTGRHGLTISWQDLSILDATCFTLIGEDTLGYEVRVEGGFGDKVDRVLAFSSPDSGTIGHQINRPLMMTWQSQGGDFNGSLAGNINLANNGGILRWNNALSTWGQNNQGLPMTWLNTNVTALAEGSDGFMVASFSAGQTLESDLKGLWVYRNETWSRIGTDTFASGVLFTHLAVSPESNDVFAVGTNRNGLYVTQDGGATFSNFRGDLDPDYPNAPTNFTVGALNWDSSRLVAFFPNFGLFISTNGGVSFNRSVIEVESDLDLIHEMPADSIPLVQPTVVNDITVDPSNEDRLLLSLNFNGVWESNNGGLTWHDLYGDLNVPGDEDNPGLWVHSAKSVAVDAGDSQVMVAAFVQEGLYRTADGGETWTLVGENAQPSGTSSLINLYARSDRGTAGLFYVLEDNWGLLRSTDSGLTWELMPDQPFINKGRQLRVSRDGTGSLLVASWGGGIFVPGSTLVLSDTYNTATSQSLRELELGLEITFVSGVVDNFEVFNLVCQTFQGWAVWRAPGHDRSDMTLLGLYDRVNPESCIEGYCGDTSYEIVPQCYVSKRATCFNFDTPDTVRFFDDEVYNGFSYYYAVSTFDYGNTALVTPANNTNAMVFSPRYELDENSPFDGPGNVRAIQINSEVADAAGGETIYVYPNPLRRGEGIPGSEGEMVVFTNLPAQSRVRVFTTAGDDVINLGPEEMQSGNTYWRTKNREGEAVSPGVYLYKVECPSREDFWGKLVIIR
jgi:hypothetical protein